MEPQNISSEISYYKVNKFTFWKIYGKWYFGEALHPIN
jgi:hypothetical protein